MLPEVQTWRYGPSGETYLVTLVGQRIENVDGPVDPSLYGEAIAFHDKRLIADFLSDADMPAETPVAAPVVSVIGTIRGGTGRRQARAASAVAEPVFVTDSPSDTGVPGTSLPGSGVAGTTTEPDRLATLNRQPNSAFVNEGVTVPRDGDLVDESGAPIRTRDVEPNTESDPASGSQTDNTRDAGEIKPKRK